jgi:hypothetical protein
VAKLAKVLQTEISGKVFKGKDGSLWNWKGRCRTDCSRANFDNLKKLYKKKAIGRKGR